MQTSHLRNQLNIYGQKITFLLLLLASSQSWEMNAQNTINLPNYDSRPLHYGFQLGIHNSVLHVRTNEALLNGTLTYQDTTALKAVRGAWQQGFSVGFIMDFALPDELWSIRLLPNVAFYNRQIDLVSTNYIEQEPLTYEATVVEVPLLLKYKSSRRRNSRMYMLGGLTGGIQVGGKEGDSGGIKLNKTNLELTYGFGFDFYWQLFKFAPEIRFAHGLNNLVQPNEVAPFIEGGTTHRVSLIFNFE